jgi:hypothetical protein
MVGFVLIFADEDDHCTGRYGKAGGRFTIEFQSGKEGWHGRRAIAGVGEERGAELLAHPAFRGAF